MHRRWFLRLLAGVSTTPFAMRFPAANAAASRRSEAWQLGLNLAGAAYWTDEHAFSNLASNASPWRLQKIDEPFTWDLPLPPMTAGGYPREVPPDTYLETFLVFTKNRGHLPLDLSVFYDGKGRLGYAHGAELVERTPGRDDIRNLKTDGAMVAQLLETDPNDPLRNIRLYPSGQEKPSGRFRPAFLARCASMSSLRFMDWGETNDSQVRRWSERPTVERFSQASGGVALEHMIELANTSGVPPWFTLPHLADDDYIRRHAELVAQTLDARLPVYVEYSNEVWNGQFAQAGYAREQGLRLGLSSNDFEAQLRFYSQRTSEMLEIWEGVFGSGKDRVLGVYAAQAVNDWTSQTVLSWGRAGAFADVLAIAPYFGGSLGSPERAGDVARWTLDQLFEELGREVDSENKAMIDNQKTLAEQFSVRLAAYEGGQHLVGHTGAENDDRLTELFQSANRDARMGELYDRHLHNWKSAGGDVYVLFNSIGGYSKWGSWGLSESEHGLAHAPKWQAVKRLLDA